MISKLTGELLDKVIEEIKKRENMSKIHVGVIDPLIHYSLNRLYPYILGSSIIFILTFVLAITILLLILRWNGSSTIIDG